MNQPLRQVLINCDDMGYHPVINQAIIEVLENGAAKSVSLMAAGPYFNDAVERLADSGITQVGVHLVLAAEYPALPMRPLASVDRVGSLVDENGYFYRDMQQCRRVLNIDEVRTEVECQIDRVKQAGLGISHVDSHMFWFEEEEAGREVHDLLADICVAHRLPMRSKQNHPAQAIADVRMFWAGFENIEQRCLQYWQFFQDFEGPLCELIIHPGIEPGRLAEFTGTGARRIADFRFFSHPDLPRKLEESGIELVGWQELGHLRPVA